MSDTFILPVPFDRVVRMLRDPDALLTALTGADAAAELDRELGTVGCATIMFGDIEGFTPLTERLGDRTAAEVVRSLDSIVHDALDPDRGHRTKSAGDGFMAVFAEPAAALRSAGRIQRSLIDGAPTGVPVRMRIGVHTGPVVRIRAANGAYDVVGRSVNLASRITDAARGGEVLVSSAVRRLTEPLGEFRFHRERRLGLKGLGGLHEIVELAWRAPERRIP